VLEKLVVNGEEISVGWPFVSIEIIKKKNWHVARLLIWTKKTQPKKIQRRNYVMKLGLKVREIDNWSVMIDI
jgi:hypothetical protein